MTASRLGAILLVIGGLIVIAGSYLPWDACPKYPCEGSGGSFVIFHRPGIDMAVGIVTALLGMGLVVFGLGSLLWWAPARWPAAVSIGLALGVLVTVAAYVVRVRLIPEYPILGIPGLGVMAVVFGAALAAVGGTLRRRAAHGPPT
jgi:hypothetical protein